MKLLGVTGIFRDTMGREMAALVTAESGIIVHLMVFPPFGEPPYPIHGVAALLKDTGSTHVFLPQVG